MKDENIAPMPVPAQGLYHPTEPDVISGTFFQKVDHAEVENAHLEIKITVPSLKIMLGVHSLGTLHIKKKERKEKKK